MSETRSIGSSNRQMTGFLKNVSLAGGALALLAVGGQSWPYAVGFGLL